MPHEENNAEFYSFPDRALPGRGPRLHPGVLTSRHRIPTFRATLHLICEPRVRAHESQSHESPQLVEIAAQPPSQQSPGPPQRPRLRDQQGPAPLQGPARLSPARARSRRRACTAAECPDSEVRIIVPHTRLRTSESKDTSNSLILVWLSFRSPHFGLAAREMRTSELPH